MQLTQKETELLKDMKGQEELCIKKYTKYASEAKCENLKNLFTSMAKTEESHLQTVNQMLQGTCPEAPGALSANNEYCQSCPESYKNQADRDNDAFLCQDMLSMEKHVSSVYNTSVFEFKNPTARRVLGHIQQEEQQHGEQIYAFMNNNNMYC